MGTFTNLKQDEVGTTFNDSGNAKQYNIIQKELPPNVKSYTQVAIATLDFAKENGGPLDAKTTLDIGAGSGFSILALSKVYPDSFITAIELAEAMFSTIPSNLDEDCYYSLHNTDAKAGLEKIEAASQEVVLINQALHWFPLFDGTPQNPNWTYFKETLTQIRRVVSNNGSLCFSTQSLSYGDEELTQHSQRHFSRHPYYSKVRETVYELIYNDPELKNVLESPYVKVPDPIFTKESLAKFFKEANFTTPIIKAEYEQLTPIGIILALQNAWMPFFEMTGIKIRAEKGLEIINQAIEIVDQFPEVKDTLETIESGEIIIYGFAKPLS